MQASQKDYDKNQHIMHRQMNNRPIRISLRVEKEAKMSQIMQQIAQIPEVNIDLGAKHTSLCMYAQSKGLIKGVFNPEYRLIQYQY